MKMVKTLTTLMVVSATLGVMWCTSGCSSGNGMDQATVDKQTKQAVNVRAVYDKVHGDWDKLTPEDREAFLKQYDGDEARAKQVWNLMAHPEAGTVRR